MATKSNAPAIRMSQRLLLGRMGSMARTGDSRRAGEPASATRRTGVIVHDEVASNTRAPCRTNGGMRLSRGGQNCLEPWATVAANPLQPVGRQPAIAMGIMLVSLHLAFENEPTDPSPSCVR